MNTTYQIKQIPGAGWTVVKRTGNRKQLRAGTGTESAPLTACNITLQQAQATAQAMAFEVQA